MSIRDRIRELRRVRAGDLHPCRWNWRDHPLAQREALQAILAEVGYAGAALARELPDGALELIDGHMRAELDPEATIPVLVLDVNEEEARKLLAVFDPLGAMAEADEEAQRKLLAEIEATEAGLRKMLEEMAARIPEKELDGRDRNALGGPVEMDLRPHEHYDYVLVLASNTQEWNQLADLLDLKPIKRRGRIGVGRGFPASKLIGLLQGLKDDKGNGKPKDRHPKPSKA